MCRPCACIHNESIVLLGKQESRNHGAKPLLCSYFPYNRFSNSRRKSAQAFATSGAFKIADTTQILVAPAAITSLMFCKLIPPMANHGTFTLSAAQRTYSSVTGFAVGFVPVAKMGPMAM